MKWSRRNVLPALNLTTPNPPRTRHPVSQFPYHASPHRRIALTRTLEQRCWILAPDEIPARQAIRGVWGPRTLPVSGGPRHDSGTNLRIRIAAPLHNLRDVGSADHNGCDALSAVISMRVARLGRLSLSFTSTTSFSAVLYHSLYSLFSSRRVVIYIL